jgi:hypothetical protein
MEENLTWGQIEKKNWERGEGGNIAYDIALKYQRTLKK